VNLGSLRVVALYLSNPCLLEEGLQSGDVLVKQQNFLGVGLICANKLILSVDVVGDEFIDFDVTVFILVALAEELIDDLFAVVLRDALLGQERHHLLLVDHTVPVKINGSELQLKFAHLIIVT